ncbi:cytochrome d ubiquinol oxidase subunit II [Solicola sp. PLA-1-18]|uniref:cytochrome d ubiquinol oxidase subunit II n=1 Tax=Solicola sp. PLA-1-18 TaxID=3380532 RepID=UPI003B7E34AC
MELTTAWFCAIAFFWLGYLVLEGFDFGVGVLSPLLADDVDQRGEVLETIGPVWDGNEVWLIVAAGATFAAFPEWYATMFSGFYLPMLLILLALIVRAVGLEYRHKRHEPWWQTRWDVAIAAGSVVAPVLWGIVLANVVRGVPIDADGEMVGGLADVLGPYALLGGAAFLVLFVAHGATFVALKTSGPVHERAERAAVRAGAVALPVGGAFVVWTVLLADVATAVVASAAVCLVALTLAVVMSGRGRDGVAFAGTALGVGALVVTMFLALFPDVMPSTLDPAWSLTTQNAASTPYTLTIMSWAGLAVTPFVLLYQGWTYWVFRRRIRTGATAGASAS